MATLGSWGVPRDIWESLLRLMSTTRIMVVPLSETSGYPGDITGTGYRLQLHRGWFSGAEIYVRLDIDKRHLKPQSIQKFWDDVRDHPQKCIEFEIDSNVTVQYYQEYYAVLSKDDSGYMNAAFTGKDITREVIEGLFAELLRAATNV